MKAHLTLAAALAAAAVTLAALGGCSSTAPQTLGGSRGTTAGETEDPGDEPGDQPGTTTGGTSAGGSSDAGIAPRADSGPGSTSSPARAFFISTTHAKLAAQCGSCHSSGAGGAPKFLDSNAEAAYIALDARALIVADSLLVTKGIHSAGGAPALSGDALTSTQQWLAMEAQERQGKNAPTNLLQVAADCADVAKFPTQLMTTMVTTRRNNENANNCTGCSNTQCASCHLAGEANTMVSDGRTQSNTEMTTFYKTKEGITRFIGVDGTKLVVSNIWQTKSQATIADQRAANIPKHPQYLLNQQRLDAITAFAQDIVTKFNAGQCPGQNNTPPTP